MRFSEPFEDTLSTLPTLPGNTSMSLSSSFNHDPSAVYFQLGPLKILGGPNLEACFGAYVHSMFAFKISEQVVSIFR